MNRGSVLVEAVFVLPLFFLMTLLLFQLILLGHAQFKLNTSAHQALRLSHASSHITVLAPAKRPHAHQKEAQVLRVDVRLSQKMKGFVPLMLHSGASGMKIE